MTEQRMTTDDLSALADETPLTAPGTPMPIDGASAATASPSKGTAERPADASLLNLIDRLAALLDRTDLDELEVQVGATGLVLRKPSALAASMPLAVPAPAGAAAPVAEPAAPAAATLSPAADAGPPARPAVMAPLSGIWYGAPAPGSAPYINVGGEVAVGQVIGLIEAMKLFNEIKSDKAGRVARINAEDGKLVRAKQPLIEVDPL
jgi:acetyl-CoA carboxylase biotin carboxyl carrier protein